MIRQGMIPSIPMKNLRHKKGLKNPADGRGKRYIEKLIDERDPCVEERTIPGHWELDTVVSGKGYGSVLVTLVERTSRYFLMKRLPSKNSTLVMHAVLELPGQIPPELVRSITTDQETEFVGWPRFARELDCDLYFCHPGHPEEKGTNENTNGLIREFIPKGSGIGKYTNQQVQNIQNALNNRPRKCLGFQTSAYIFNQMHELHNVSLV